MLTQVEKKKLKQLDLKTRKDAVKKIKDTLLDPNKKVGKLKTAKRNKSPVKDVTSEKTGFGVRLKKDNSFETLIKPNK